MPRYRIVPNESRVWIEARSNVHPINSTTDGLEGYVDLEVDGDGVDLSSAAPAGALSFQVTRLTSGNRLEDRELHKRIDARRFPTIDGVLTEIRRVDGQASYRVSGELTFRGVSRPVADDMTIDVIDDDTLRLEGRSQFDIRDFGMEPPRILILRVEPRRRRPCRHHRRPVTGKGASAMCLGIPGQIVELMEQNEHLARADVSGVSRVINIGLLEDEHAAYPATGC